jgi:hypothetical protein
MTGLLAILPIAAFCLAAPAWADDLIRQANSQEALILGVSHLSAGLQSVDRAGVPVLNNLSGPQIEAGYSNTRMRTLFGLPNIYRRVDFTLGLGQQDFAGNPANPSSGVVGASPGPFNVETESLRLRVGYTRQFGAGARMALTPFLGLAQSGWVRGATGYSGTTGYLDCAAEIGLLGQAALTPKIVIGADASVGHILGALLFNKPDLTQLHGGFTSSFELYMDNRTSADWHQRLVLRQSFQRYPEPAQSVGSFEPRRNSAISVQLEFGTELDLFEYLFR